MSGVEVRSFYYDRYVGLMRDDDDNLDWNVHKLIPPDRFSLVSKVGGTEYVDSVEPGVRYEFVFPFPDDEAEYLLYYDIEHNVMRDECGFPIYDIFSIISPNALYLFKTRKDDMMVRTKTGESVGLIWPLDKNDGVYIDEDEEC
jgi:hypothetical protein